MAPSPPATKPQADSTLDLRSFSAVNNTVENVTTGTNGWYAQDHAKLILPPIPVAAGSSYNWGEAAPPTQPSTWSTVSN